MEIEEIKKKDTNKNETSPLKYLILFFVGLALLISLLGFFGRHEIDERIKIEKEKLKINEELVKKIENLKKEQENLKKEQKNNIENLKKELDKAYENYDEVNYEYIEQIGDLVAKQQNAVVANNRTLTTLKEALNTLRNASNITCSNITTTYDGYTLYSKAFFVYDLIKSGVLLLFMNLILAEISGREYEQVGQGQNEGQKSFFRPVNKLANGNKNVGFFKTFILVDLTKNIIFALISNVLLGLRDDANEYAFIQALRPYPAGKGETRKVALFRALYVLGASVLSFFLKK